MGSGRAGPQASVSVFVYIDPSRLYLMAYVPYSASRRPFQSRRIMQNKAQGLVAVAVMKGRGSFGMRLDFAGDEARNLFLVYRTTKVVP